MDKKVKVVYLNDVIGHERTFIWSAKDFWEICSNSKMWYDRHGHPFKLSAVQSAAKILLEHVLLALHSQGDHLLRAQCALPETVSLPHLQRFPRTGQAQREVLTGWSPGDCAHPWTCQLGEGRGTASLVSFHSQRLIIITLPAWNAAPCGSQSSSGSRSHVSCTPASRV